ncbi:unnamed protein product [Phytophthora lilii]|uniref:Unnamed protein product n=1 Tax=Phytophthora lilii TaxID=2077276 RepID=A0A9W6X583_9STRA|nr:unnamed protein product [Phytophthora lilii]
MDRRRGYMFTVQIQALLCFRVASEHTWFEDISRTPDEMAGIKRFIGSAVIAFFALCDYAVAHDHDVGHRRLKTSLAEASSLKLHVTLQRKAMELHGESEFDVFANPVVSDDDDSVLYDGFATFVDGHSRFTYTLVDGAAYLVTNDSSSNAATVRCIPPSTLPFNDILPALNDATPIPSASVGGEAIECESGNLFKTSFAGVHYAICASGDDSGFTAFASDVTIDVEYLESPVSILRPKLSDGSSCEEIAIPTSVTPTALALLTGSPLPKTK